MDTTLNCGMLLDYISKNYDLRYINNTDFIIDLYLRLKIKCGIKSSIKQGWIGDKSTVYLQIKNKIDILHVYFLEEQCKLCVVNIYNSDITDKRYKG